ncbi:MAG: S-adenosyl-l-methionine hydroxide adenosyltransferase family protein [Halobacteriaceae archaeon]
MLTLSSDFGTPYPAAMRGAALQETDARLVDISHEFPRQDVATAGFWLREILPWFPPAVHCVVVDPGVGTDRAALAVRAGEHVLVGPDNGVLMPAARALTDGDLAMYAIEYDAASSTFHGRDVFAPMAARLHEWERTALGSHPDLVTVTDVEELRFPEPTLDADPIVGTVLVVDGFGNAITNIPGRVLTTAFGGTVAVDGASVYAARSYAVVDPGERLVTVGSHGNVELAVNRGEGTEAFGVEVGSEVRLSLA